MLRIYLLGSFRAEVNNQAITLPRIQGLAEFWAYLVLHTDRPIQRNQLAFILWPDEAEEDARTRLRAVLHALNQFLPPTKPDFPWILAKGHTLRWNPQADYWLDVTTLQTALKNGALNKNPNVLELYQADLLTDMDAEWLALERAKLHASLCLALDQAASQLEKQGQNKQALFYAEKLFQLEPDSESVFRLVLRLRFLNGDRMNALRLCQQAIKRDPQGASPDMLTLREWMVSTRLPSDETSLAQTPSNQHQWPVGKVLKITSLVFLITAILSGIVVYRPFFPPQTLNISGPQQMVDTWIDSACPDQISAAGWEGEWLEIDLHDGRGWTNPHLPFAQYPAIRLNLANRSIEDALLKFDLQKLPALSWVEKAELRVTLQLDETSSGKTHLVPIKLGVFRLLKDWDPNQTTFSSPWSQPGLEPGVDYETLPLSEKYIKAPGPVEFDLSAAFPAWQTGHNYGLLLMVIEAPGGDSPYWLLSSEYPDPAARPHLAIQYR
jgi:DNA-binding SARP family transcriptional activator